MKKLLSFLNLLLVNVTGILIWTALAILFPALLALLIIPLLWLIEKTVSEFSYFVLLLDLVVAIAIGFVVTNKTVRFRIKELLNQLKSNM